MPDILDSLFSVRVVRSGQDFWATSLPNPEGFAVITSAHHRQWAIVQLTGEKFVDQEHFESVVKMAAGDLIKGLPFNGAPDAREKKQLIKGLFLHLTTRCNLFCKHCYYLETPRRPHEDLELSVIENLIVGLKRRGLARVTLSGGEPLLHPDFSRIIRLIHSHDLSLMLLTNGTLEMNECAGLLGPHDLALVSLHGPDKKSHERQNGLGTYKRVIKNLDLLRDAIPAENIVINCTMSDWNIDQLEKMVELTASLGLSHIRFMPLHQIAGKTDSGPTLDYQSESVLHWARTAARRIADNRWPIQVGVGFTGLPGYLNHKTEDWGDNVCGIGQRLTVSADGTLHLCPCFMGDESLLGDCGDARDLDAVLIGIEKWEKVIHGRRETISQCRNCPLSGICQAGCPALAFQTTGSFQAVDPLCLAVREYSIEYFSRLAGQRIEVGVDH
jgi:radical SAM protein with 4Fe4S-binding SPASM domain